MDFTYTVTVAVRRESGKFATREEVDHQLRENLDIALSDNITGVGADGDSVYVVDDYSIT